MGIKTPERDRLRGRRVDHFLLQIITAQVYTLDARRCYPGNNPRCGRIYRHAIELDGVSGAAQSGKWIKVIRKT